MNNQVILDKITIKNRIKSHAYVMCIILAALCYAVLRFSLNVEYKNATWESLYNFTAPIPFGYRILVPIISRPLVYTGLSIKEAYFFWEVIATVLLIVGLYNVFKIYIDDRWSKFFSIIFLYTLPLLFLLKLQWPVYYPSDTLAIAFIVWSVLCVLKRRWVALSCLLLMATLNRESAILIPMIFFAIYIGRFPLRKNVLILLLLCALYFCVRCAVYLFTKNNPMPYNGPMAFIIENEWRVIHNIIWLVDVQNILILISTLGGIPLFYYGFRSYIPQHLRRLYIIVAVYISMLIFVGNIYEPRIFGEVSVILYIPLALAVFAYLQRTVVKYPNDTLLSNNEELSPCLLGLVDDYFFISIGLLVAVVVFVLNKLGVAYLYH